MADTTWVPGTIISSPWLQDVNDNTYKGTVGGVPNSSISKFIASGAGAVQRSVQSELRDRRVNVKDFGAVGDGVTNDFAAITAAMVASKNLYFPNGTYTIGNNTLNPQQGFCFFGQQRGGVQLTRTGAGAIITPPYFSENTTISNIYFTGAGNTGIGQAATAGTFQGYLVNPKIYNCDFGYELAFGINTDLLYGTIDQCTFGYFGTGAPPAAGASTMVALKSVVYPATTNFTNLNIVSNSIIRAGNNGTGAVQISSGVSWKFLKVDFSFGGLSLDLRDVQTVEFDTCWWEGNVYTGGPTARIDLGTANSNTVFRNCYANVGSCRSFLQWTSGFTQTVTMHDGRFDLDSGCTVIFDGNTSSTLLPGSGNIAFYKNIVNGGSASNKLVTTTQFMGASTSVRAWGIVNSTGAAILSATDVGMTAVRNSAGNLTLTFTHPNGSSSANVCVIASGQAGAIKTGAAAANTVSLITVSGADDIIHFQVFGK